MTTTLPVEAVKPGTLIVLKSRPVRVERAATLSMGMHGVRKVIVTGFDVLTGRKVNDVFASDKALVSTVETTQETVEVVSVDSAASMASIASGDAVPVSTPELSAQISQLLAEKKKASVVVVRVPSLGEKAVVALSA